MSRSYSWMPGWLRKFMNLDDELPGYGPSSYRPEGDYDPPARQTFSTYTPPAPAPRYTPSYPQTAGEEQTRRFAPGYATPPAPAAGEPVAPRGVTPATYPAPPRTVGATGTVQPDGTVSPGGNVPSIDTQGYVQPVGYLLRSYARGALPPQGLEQFTREFRATLTDVWNFYSYWTRFQTDELMRIGREAMDAVSDNLPASAETGTAGSSVRRIKVTVGNGGTERRVDRVATSVPVEAPPTTTPAPPPAPPAPTATFSPTVTADDAAIPPEGRDTSAAFAARMADTAAEVRSDIAADTAPIAGDIAADAGQAAAQLEAGAADAARGAADAIQSAGDATQAAAERAAETVDEAARDVADRLKGGEQKDRP